jgi:outer membrane protein OmpA-like peptidoglycan-associated protein
MKNIFFNTNSVELLDESKLDLNQLLELLKSNANLKVEISGHTDDVGKDETNLTLSDNRAKSVVAYLVDNGINAERLVAKGYGETQPIAENTDEEGRSKNRRTEFKIIEK